MITALNADQRTTTLDTYPAFTASLSGFAVESTSLTESTSSNQSLDLSSLDDILQRIDRSNSWVYLHGLVPMYDPEGREIENAKTPAWPWEILPPPVIKVGKKAWLTQDIDQWIARMDLRAKGLEDTLLPINTAQVEKAHG